MTECKDRHNRNVATFLGRRVHIIGEKKDRENWSKGAAML